MAGSHLRLIVSRWVPILSVKRTDARGRVLFTRPPSSIECSRVLIEITDLDPPASIQSANATHSWRCTCAVRMISHKAHASEIRPFFRPRTATDCTTKNILKGRFHLLSNGFLLLKGMSKWIPQPLVELHFWVLLFAYFKKVLYCLFQSCFC